MATEHGRRPSDLHRVPSGRPSPPPRRWSGIVLALCLVLIPGAGCGPGSEPGTDAPPPDLPPERAESPPTPAPDRTDVVALAAPPATAPPGAFPHVEHRSLACRTCHASVPGHGTHGDVECTTCHPRPTGQEVRPTRSWEGCMACHHSPERRAEGCPSCHGSSEDGSFVLPVREPPAAGESARDPTGGLPFSHDPHRAVPCASCHEGGTSLAVERSCDSCHERHHRPDASCMTCHDDVRDAHDAQAHLGCGGDGCHTSPTVLALPESRSVCLTCHQDRAQHEPGRECATCHATGRPDAPARVRGGGS